jgi:pyruvate/2-oxoacid:ferredoxin oxidoreductase beta subunit
MAKPSIPTEEYMGTGHFGCLGCGACNAMRYALKALGPNTIITVPACCWAVMPGVFPYTCIKVPMLYHAFEVTGAAISGVEAALKALGREDVNVVGWAGDGGTMDIGIQAISGAAERGHNVIYICYDNEAYMNTGIQRSSSTPVGAWTTTTQVGPAGDWKKAPKKNFPEIMVAHGVPYVATANIAWPEDFIKKIQKAKEIRGFKYIQVYASCPTGWKSDPAKGIEIARMAVKSRIYPIYEVENGRYTISKSFKDKLPVKDYLMTQGRFRHLPENVIEEIQKDVDRQWEILNRKVEFTKDAGPVAEGGEE